MVKLLIAIHIMAIMTVFLSAVSWFFQLTISGLILVNLILYLRSSNNVGIIRYSTLMGWEWLDLEHDFLPIEVLPGSVITPLLIVLHFKKQNNKKKAIIVYKDSLLESKYRQLLINLKINGLN